MKSYMDTIKATVDLLPRWEDSVFYDGSYLTAIHMISLIHERTIKEVETDIQAVAQARREIAQKEREIS